MAISGKRRKVLARRSKQREQLPELVYEGGPTEVEAELGPARLDLGRMVAGILDPDVDPEMQATGAALLVMALQAHNPGVPDDWRELVASYRRLQADGWLRIKDGVAYRSEPDRPELLRPMGFATVNLTA